MEISTKSMKGSTWAREKCMLEIIGKGLDLSGIIKQFKNLHRTEIKS
jgi:hypothetical protein